MLDPIQMPPRQRPEGLEWEITDEWLAWLERRMREEGLSQRALADRIVEAGGQATGAAISDIQTRKAPKSKLVPAINAVLGGIVPTQHIVAHNDALDGVRERISQLVGRMTPDEAEALLRVVEHMTKRR